MIYDQRNDRLIEENSDELSVYPCSINFPQSSGVEIQIFSSGENLFLHKDKIDELIDGLNQAKVLMAQ
jgi:hypothetical protein